MPHPNRSRRDDAPARNPSWEEIRATRMFAGLTQTEAARCAFVTLSAWQRWETEPAAGEAANNSRRMPAAAWWCFKLATGLVTLDELRAAISKRGE